MRQRSTNVRGGAFSAAEIEAVWNKGTIISGYDAAVWRRDACGTPMKRFDYGQTTQYGWEIDHIRPVAHSGGDEMSNLQPLQWESNRFKGDNWPNWSCKVA